MMKIAFIFILLLLNSCFTQANFAQKQPQKSKSTLQSKKLTPYKNKQSNNKKKRINNKKKHSYKRKKHHSNQLKKTSNLSAFVFTNSRGAVTIKLPKAKIKTYKLVIFESNRVPLFTIQKIPETELILEKGNFLHEGWFTFDLFEDGTLLERNKFFISKN